MALADGYLFHVVARLGESKDVPALIMGEFGFDVDTQTMRIGNDTARPPKIATTESKDDFDFSKASKFTLPGGVVFDKTKPGAIDGVSVAKLNQSNGLIARRGDNTFGAVTISSSDKSLLVQGGAGTQGILDLRVNPDSDIIQRLFSGIGILNVDSIAGLRDWLDTLAANIVTAREHAISTVRGNVQADYNTLEKIMSYINNNTIVVGDPSGVAAQVITILRDGVIPERNTLRKLSDAIDGYSTRLSTVENRLDEIGIGGNFYDPYFYAIIKDQTANTRLMLEQVDRFNKEMGYYGR